MAGRGPAPKPVLQRESRTQARNDAATKLTADGELRGPELPEGDWHPRTMQWWANWRASAQAQVMTATDWDVLAETAILHTELWNGDSKAAAELRLRVAKFGATIEDRLRLKMQVDVEVKEAATPKRGMTAQRRRDLLKVVQNGSA